MGHLLSNHVIGVTRALVSLGDVKSQKYTSEWLKRLAGYTEHFENVGVQKVASALQIAWTRQDGSATGSNEEQDARQHKRPKSSSTLQPSVNSVVDITLVSNSRRLAIIFLNGLVHKVQ